MSYSYGSFNIFADTELDYFLASKRESLRTEILNEAEDYTLNVNEEQYIAHLAEKYAVENLCLEGEVFASDYEKDIPAERFPLSFYVRQGESYRKPVIRYHVPFVGNHDLLRCVPSSRLLWTTKVSIEDSCICFDIINFDDNVEQISREANGTINNIKRQLQNVQKQVDSYNTSLDGFARSTFQARKQQLLKKNNLMASLGVPIKKRGDLARTYSVPNAANHSTRQ